MERKVEKGQRDISRFDYVVGPVLPRKEVIQPQVLLRLPCYDFTPLAKVTLGALKRATSGTPHSVGVTGGVYNPRVHIHRSMADLRLLAIPASCGRVADHNQNWGRFFEIGSTLPYCNPLYLPL